MGQGFIPYKDIESKLQTGDIVLFHGVLRESRWIEAFEDSQWSHVGMVVRIPQYDGPVLWESNTLVNLPDVELHKAKTGPMLVPLYDRLKTDLDNRCDVMFAVRRLNVERTPEMLQELLDFIVEVHNAQFPSEWEMVIRLMEGKLGIQADFKSFFCSELAAETYIKMGLLSPSKPSNSYEPKDFSSEGHIELLKGAGLEPEVYIQV